MVKQKNIFNEGEKELFKAFLSINNVREFKEFLSNLLSEKELSELINRWNVARMLDKHIPYEKISESTGLSSTTIARVSKYLRLNGYKKVISRL